MSCGALTDYSCAVDVLVESNWIRYSMPLNVAENERGAIAEQAAAEIVRMVRGG